MVEISRIELLALRKLAIINHALAKSFKNGSVAREQLALTQVLVDVIARADLAAPTPSAVEPT